MKTMILNAFGTITEGKVNIGKGITFATIQTMCKLDLSRYKDFWDVIIVDECFPAGTQIQTPHGTVPIQFICPGELVLTRNEFSGKLEFCEVEELQVRIAAIQECECQPYVMIYHKPSASPITRRLQRWTNSTMLYAKTQDFIEYQRMNYKTVLEGKGGITNDERRSNQNRSSAVSRLQTLRYFACIA